jgi:sugar/nucleoside kinase (ribokinase family)
VTIDCKWDTFIAQHAAALVVSNEFIHNEYPGADIPALMEQYRAHCAGWVIFTFGAGDVLFTLPGQSTIQRFTPYKVDVVDTLGAGDTFRAGIVYGLLKKMDILESVRFASALAGVACTRFPSVLVPPSLEEVEAMIGLQE